MNNWITKKAFIIAFVLMMIARLSVLSEHSYTFNEVISAIFTSIVGGLFWGAIGVYVSKRISKKIE